MPLIFRYPVPEKILNEDILTCNVRLEVALNNCRAKFPEANRILATADPYRVDQLVYYLYNYREYGFSRYNNQFPYEHHRLDWTEEPDMALVEGKRLLTRERILQYLEEKNLPKEEDYIEPFKVGK